MSSFRDKADMAVSHCTCLLLTQRGPPVVLNEPCLSRYDAPVGVRSTIMKRREVTRLLGGLVVAPLAARAQPAEKALLIGLLMVTAAGDPEVSRRLAALQGELARLGWVEGRNITFQTRWTAGEPDRIRQAANELVSLAPDLIVVNGSAGMDAMRRATRTIPVLFVVVVDSVGGGYAESVARPGGNATGFSQFEYSIGGKWLELIKELRPTIKRVGIVRDPTANFGPGSVRRNSISRTLARRRSHSAQSAFRRRIRTRHHGVFDCHGLCPHCGGERVGSSLPQSNHRVGSQIQTSCS